MDKETLLRRRAEIEQRFTSLTEQKQQIETEMIKLQGEYRLIEDLLHPENKRMRKEVEENAED